MNGSEELVLLNDPINVRSFSKNYCLHGRIEANYHLPENGNPLTNGSKEPVHFSELIENNFFFLSTNPDGLTAEAERPEMFRRSNFGP